MELQIANHPQGWFIAINNQGKDEIISKYLTITLQEYRSILDKHNPIIIGDKTLNGEYFFENKKDVRAAVKELEPYLIMANLIK